MLDASLVAQLTDLFSALHSELTLALSPSRHAQQQELRGML